MSVSTVTALLRDCQASLTNVTLSSAPTTEGLSRSARVCVVAEQLAFEASQRVWDVGSYKAVVIIYFNVHGQLS